MKPSTEEASRLAYQALNDEYAQHGMRGPPVSPLLVHARALISSELVAIESSDDDQTV